MFNKFKVGEYVVHNVHEKIGAQLIIEIKINSLSTGDDMLVFSRDRRQKCFAGYCRLATKNEIKLAKIKKCFELK
jgi:hypothetical protein